MTKTQKTPPKTSITQRLRADLGRSVGVTTVTQPEEFKELLEHLKSPHFNYIKSMKSFDFSTLYTTIPHQKLKSKLATIIQNSFIHTNGNRRYRYFVLGREDPILSRNILIIKTGTLKMTSLTY